MSKWSNLTSFAGGCLFGRPGTPQAIRMLRAYISLLVSIVVGAMLFEHYNIPHFIGVSAAATWGAICAGVAALPEASRKVALHMTFYTGAVGVFWLSRIAYQLRLKTYSFTWVVDIPLMVAGFLLDIVYATNTHIVLSSVATEGNTMVVLGDGTWLSKLCFFACTSMLFFGYAILSFEYMLEPNPSSKGSNEGAISLICYVVVSAGSIAETFVSAGASGFFHLFFAIIGLGMAIAVLVEHDKQRDSDKAAKAAELASA